MSSGNIAAAIVAAALAADDVPWPVLELLVAVAVVEAEVAAACAEAFEDGAIPAADIKGGRPPAAPLPELPSTALKTGMLGAITKICNTIN